MEEEGVVDVCGGGGSGGGGSGCVWKRGQWMCGGGVVDVCEGRGNGCVWRRG